MLFLLLLRLPKSLRLSFVLARDMDRAVCGSNDDLPDWLIESRIERSHQVIALNVIE